LSNGENTSVTESEVLSDYIIIILNHLDKIQDLGSITELLELLNYSPEGLKSYSKVFQDCIDFYVDNKRFPDVPYLVSLHRVLVYKKDCPFSLDILIQLKKELLKHKKSEEIRLALDKNDISKIRDIVNSDVHVEKKKPLGMDGIFDVYEKQELMPRGVMIGIPEVDYYLKGLDYGSLNVVGAPPQSFKCVLEGTRIHTSLGYTKIEDIPHGDLNGENFGNCELIVRDGYKTSHFYNGGIKDTLTIESPYFKLTGTPIHPIRVLGEEGVSWKKLEELKIGDYVCLDRKKDILFNNNVIKPSFLEHCTDEDFGYLVGYLYGDGSFGKSYYSISGTSSNLKEINRITGLDSTVVPDKRRKDTHSLRFTKEQSLELAGLGLTGKADSKEIPEWIYSSNINLITGFLSGIFEADGSFLEVCTLNLKSHKLIYSVRDLFNLLGIYPSINKYEFGYTYKDKTRREYIYRLEVSRGDFKKLEFLNLRGAKSTEAKNLIDRYKDISNTLEIPYVLKYKKIILDNTNKYISNKTHKHYRDNRKFFIMYETCRGWKKNLHFGEKSWKEFKSFTGTPDTEIDYDLDNYYFKPITGITKGVGRVYDLSVPESHTFTANGIVNHNTTFAISTAYTASHDEGKKVLFITLEVVPKNVLYNIISRHSFEMFGKDNAIPAVDLKKTLLDETNKAKFKLVQEDFMATCKGNIHIAGVDDLEEYSMEYIEAYILRVREEMGGLDLVYVDYLNLFKNKIPPKLKLDQYQALNYYVDALQHIAIKHNLIVILLCQLKTEAIDKLNGEMDKADKNGTSSSEVKLASSTYFAEANALGRTSMTAMIFHTTPAMKNSGRLNIHIVKNRDFETPERPIQTVVTPSFFIVGTRQSNFSQCSPLSPSFNSSNNSSEDVNSMADDFMIQDIEETEIPIDMNTQGNTPIETTTKEIELDNFLEDTDGSTE